MSMISSLIDELRQMADGQATFHDAREVMLEAAGTIWELRNDLQRANAENAKLQNDAELLREMLQAKRQETHALMSENAKLREAFNATLIRLSAANDAAGGGFMDSRYCELLRELGIEVDG